MSSGIYCFTTGTLVENNGMRAGYDCKCTGCKEWLQRQKDQKR